MAYYGIIDQFISIETDINVLYRQNFEQRSKPNVNGLVPRLCQVQYSLKLFCYIYLNVIAYDYYSSTERNNCVCPMSLNQVNVKP